MDVHLKWHVCALWLKPIYVNYWSVLYILKILLFGSVFVPSCSGPVLCYISTHSIANAILIIISSYHHSSPYRQPLLCIIHPPLSVRGGTSSVVNQRGREGYSLPPVSEV
jgi:hypothetical protein